MSKQSMKRIENHRQKLIRYYDQLDPVIKQVVQVAVSGLPLSRTRLLEAARQIGVKHQDGRELAYKTDREAIDAVIENGVLEYQTSAKSGPVQVAVTIQDYVFRQAFNSGIAKIVRSNDFFREKRRQRYTVNPDLTIARMRFAFYGNNFREWQQLTEMYGFLPSVLIPFCQPTFDSLTPRLQAEFFNRSSIQLVNFAEISCNQVSASALAMVVGMKGVTDDVVCYATDLLIAQGDISGLKELAKLAPSHRQIEACIAFLQGDYETARQQFDLVDAEQRKRTKKRTTNLSGLSMVLFAILLCRENTKKSRNHLKQITNTIAKWNSDLHLLSGPFELALAHQNEPMTRSDMAPVNCDYNTPLNILVMGWVWQWYYSDQESPFNINVVQAIATAYAESDLTWLAAEANLLLAKMIKGKVRTKQLKDKANAAHLEMGTRSIVDFIAPVPVWEIGLLALENLCQVDEPSTPSADDAVNDERMIWEVVIAEHQLWPTPYIQKCGAKGWSKGRKVGLSRLYEQWDSLSFDFLTEQDRAICRALRQYADRNYYGYQEFDYHWDTDKLAAALVGHPHVYLSGQRDEPVQLLAAQPHLTIKPSGKQFRLVIEPSLPNGGSPIHIIKDGQYRYRIVMFNEKQLEVAALVEELPSVPADQRDRVFEIAQSLSSVIDVRSDVEGGPSSGKEVEPSTQIVSQLTPFQDGLRAEFFVQPLGEKGPFCRPGAGAQSIMANVDGVALTAVRDLKVEKKNLRKLIKLNPSLDSRTIDDNQFEWLFAGSDEALEFVVQLQELAEQGLVTVLWPRGKTHDVAGRAGASAFQVSVKRDRDWFAASGKLKVDKKLTVDLMQLLDLASASPSRFVKMDDGRYLELTEELRHRIADISALGTPMKNQLRFAPVRAVVVDELLGDIDLKTDKHWKAHVAQIEEAGTIAVDAPSTFQAELRDYQAEGYAWLKRLAHWNTGACLADDMGLGKTIQSLALLVERGLDGPQLIVAPASVGFNWESETHRFAPTLTPKLFRDCDRDQFFECVQPGDLVIASYGLLQSEIERFKEIQWHTVLLDEAQAIKNMATKRSQAVMQLPADFRMILTGTPMENHLGELWNLFRFIVPGLLGSQDEFRKRYANPIERDQCRQSRNRLKNLIQPFMLRRTKATVLSELPARSESVLEIELSPAEAALYEALRLKALERIAEVTDEEKSQGEKHLQVLAELTRLRLACCHPQLVGGDGIESAKLDLFRQKVREIVEGRHKVLVFSQFVKHLEILREELDEMGISYQYLDGSTSVKKRKQAVEAFQAGQGDVFLISLKAGGTGLNLTAADYVIHMDPWWNPAVEDQATDRAHRIGQQRPVNVYRFITKGTIEEKIVELHKTKRDLADSLLAGSDASGKLTTDELIGLLKDNQLALTSS